MTELAIKVNGEQLEKIPEDLFIPPEALEIFLDTFEGPLDLLLYLIRKQNFDILNIPVAVITEQYMQYVELMRKIRLDLAGEYLVMAAMLAQIKSRMLLPRPEKLEEEEGEDPRATLVKQLQVYEQFRQAAKDIDELPRQEREFFVVQSDINVQIPESALPHTTLDELSNAFRLVLRRAEENRNMEIVGEVLSVRERMGEIMNQLNQLSGNQHLRFESLFSADEGREGLVVSFIAILELVRDGLLSIIQNDAFSPIHIKAAA